MYHKHKNLKASKIKDLACDANIAAMASDRVGKTLDVLSAVFIESLKQGRRLKSDELELIVDTIEHNFENDMIVIAQRYFDKPASRTRPKSEEFERNYVVVSNLGGDFFTIFAIRFHVTRRMIHYSCSELPIAFTYHCAERLMERGRNISQAAKEISLSLLEMLIFSKLAEPVSAEHLQNYMILPAIELDGAFLGTYDMHDPYDYKMSFKDINGLIPHSSGVTARKRYVAKTFVDDKKLSRKQEEVIDNIFDWRADCDIIHEQAMVKELWPECHMSEEERSIKGLGLGQGLINYLKSPKVVDTVIRPYIRSQMVSAAGSGTGNKGVGSLHMAI